MGKGFCKFNNSLLQEQTYVNLVKSNYQKVREHYSLKFYKYPHS